MNATSRMLCLVAALFLDHPLAAVDCSLPDSRMVTQQGNGFGITSNGFSSFDVQAAINYWSGCSGYGPEIPTLEFGGSGNIPVSVVKVSGNSTVSGGGCGGTSLGLTNGQVTSATIMIFTKESDGDSCEPLTDVIAHEFGHLFGLTDAPNFACTGHIMGARLAGGTRAVAGDDCEIADSMWTTTTESFIDPYCEAYCPTQCTGSICEGHPSPILLDLEGDGIHLTGLDDPVWFDIDADGLPNLLSWTDRSEGFLALDRNFNGAIDNGGELFGNVTRLSDGSLPLNGYIALAELDSWAFGGNRDGHLDATDPAFNTLLLWTDRNHDGEAGTGELLNIGKVGVVRIDLDFRRSRRVDSHGNLFAFSSRAWRTGPRGTVRPLTTWDVYFSEAP